MSGGGLIVSNCHGGSGGILGDSLNIALGITFLETWLSTRVSRGGSIMGSGLFQLHPRYCRHRLRNGFGFLGYYLGKSGMDLLEGGSRGACRILWSMIFAVIAGAAGGRNLDNLLSISWDMNSS